MSAQFDRIGELGSGARVAPRHQLNAGPRMRVHVRLAAEVFDEVDDDVHTAGVTELEVLGPDSDGDLVQPGLADLGQVGALQYHCAVAHLHTVCGDRQRLEIHRG